MHQFIYFDGQIISAIKANLLVISSAALYGRGVFTTMAVKNKAPFLWEKHWHRLNDNAEKIGVDLSEFSEAAVKSSLAELIEKNKANDARARITFFDGSASQIWQIETNRKTSLLIATADLRSAPDVLRLTVSPFSVNSTSPLAGVKSCNYLENLLALEEAKNRGFDEAIRLNEKQEIVSASTANVFWVKNKKIFTPALETGCLMGTTREFLLENFAVRAVKARLNKIVEADEVFLTSAGIGICPANFDNVKNGNFSAVPELKKFLDLPGVKS